MDGTYILVVDDESRIRKLLRDFFTAKGYQILEAEDGEKAIEVFEENRNKIKLILLDVMMPTVDGFTLCRYIRDEVDCPIIFITAKTMEEDILEGFSIGADDYITKPFNPLELIARVKSNLRRYMNFGNFNNETREDVLRSGGLELNTSTKEVKVDGNQVKVTPIEYRILELLLRNKGRVFSIDEIYEKVWKEESFNVENTVAVHIRRIREKIEINPKEPRYLKVVWGIGYKIEKI